MKKSWSQLTNFLNSARSSMKKGLLAKPRWTRLLAEVISWFSLKCISSAGPWSTSTCSNSWIWQDLRELPNLGWILWKLRASNASTWTSRSPPSLVFLKPWVEWRLSQVVKPSQKTSLGRNRLSQKWWNPASMAQPFPHLFSVSPQLTRTPEKHITLASLDRLQQGSNPRWLSPSSWLPRHRSQTLPHLSRISTSSLRSPTKLQPLGLRKI